MISVLIDFNLCIKPCHKYVAEIVDFLADLIGR